MKKLNIVLVTTVAVSNFVYAGGDILPTVFETEEVYVPVEEPIQIVEPIPEVVEPIEPVVIPQPIPIPVEPLKEIIPLGLYAGLGLTLARYNPSCGCAITGDVDKTAGVIGRVGYDFNQFIGVEARGIRTNWKSNGGKFKHYGAFVKPMYPLGNRINAYGLAGLASTKTEGTTRQLMDVKGFAWGAGLEYDLGADCAKKGRYSRDFDGYGDQEGGWGLFADYERLYQKSGSPDLDTISAGVTYDF